MTDHQRFQNIIKKTSILKTPKRRLSTFGETKIVYFFISEIENFEDRCRLRKGWVVAEKPKILMAESTADRFEGFGQESEAFRDWLSKHYGETFRGLEYRFKNENSYSEIEHSSCTNLTAEIKKRLTAEELDQSVILTGPDDAWQVSLMKFIVDECMASFGPNVQELDEHGFFDSPEKVLKKRKNIVEDLFLKAKQDSGYLPSLQKKLEDFGMFKEYEDEFFKLVK